MTFVSFYCSQGKHEVQIPPNKGVLPAELIQEMRQVFRRSEELLDVEMQSNNKKQKEQADSSGPTKHKTGSDSCGTWPSGVISFARLENCCNFARRKGSIWKLRVQKATCLNQQSEWTGGDLNPRPPACKAGILPLNYQPIVWTENCIDFNCCL